MTGEPREITSPNYPIDKYDRNIECVTRLYSNDGRMIRLAFETFDLESSSSCVYDYLEVFKILKIYLELFI